MCWVCYLTYFMFSMPFAFSFPASVVPSPSNRYPTNLKKENPSLSTSSTSNSPEDSPKEPPSSLPPPDIPKSHPACDPPLCPQCAKRGTEFFNLQCDGCWYSLKRTNLSPSQVFAVLRQWDSRVQKNIGPLVGLVSSPLCEDFSLLYEDFSLLCEELYEDFSLLCEELYEDFSLLQGASKS